MIRWKSIGKSSINGNQVGIVLILMGGPNKGDDELFWVLIIQDLSQKIVKIAVHYKFQSKIGSLRTSKPFG